MKKITVEIPLDEAVALIGSSERATDFIEQEALNKDKYLTTGVLLSVRDRVVKAVLSQATDEEIDNI